jgi:chemotaxis protein MotB
MASYMLIRGKLDERRIERIEGYADRSLRNAADPLAAENRRIEILVRPAK